MLQKKMKEKIDKLPPYMHWKGGAVTGHAIQRMYERTGRWLSKKDAERMINDIKEGRALKIKESTYEVFMHDRIFTVVYKHQTIKTILPTRLHLLLHHKHPISN